MHLLCNFTSQILRSNKEQGHDIVQSVTTDENVFHCTMNTVYPLPCLCLRVAIYCCPEDDKTAPFSMKLN